MGGSDMNRGLSGDVLFELTMQHISDLRTDAENGREYRRSGSDPSDHAAEQVITKSSAIGSTRPQPSH